MHYLAPPNIVLKCQILLSTSDHPPSRAGQFRGTKGHEITQRDAFDSAQNLAARTGALIHVYEERMVTNGEVIVEVCNTNIGMNHLHSVLPVCGAVVSSVLACVDGSGK